MKTSLRLALGAGLVLSSLLTGCKSGAGTPSSHWNIDSVDDRIVKHFTGYRGGVDGTYLEFQRRKKDALNLTIRRHFLNNNPDNPFQPEDASRFEHEAPYGPLPNPVNWFSAESIFIGAALLAWTGTFIPLPLDSIIALASPDGAHQFGQTFTGDWRGETPRPPKVSTFRVKNR